MSHLVFEIGEAVSLLIGLIGYVILLIEFKRNGKLLHLFLAYTFLLIGAISTVAEDFFLGNIFNLLEHTVGMALAGVAFGVTVFLANKKIVALETNVNKKLRSR